MLSDRQTQLHFDNFISDLIHLSNGTTQGCPLSMLLYAFYNTELIEIAHGKNELAAGFVDDCAFIATANNLDRLPQDPQRHDGATKQCAELVPGPQLKVRNFQARSYRLPSSTQSGDLDTSYH